MPCYYKIDSDKVVICYLLLPNEIYLWENIKSITECEFFSPHSRSSFFHIKGTVEGKKHFYMKGYIKKSFRSKHLMSLYWKKIINNQTVNNYMAKKKYENQFQKKSNIIVSAFKLKFCSIFSSFIK